MKIIECICDLRNYCNEYSQKTTVHKMNDGLPDWNLINGQLCNNRSSYFKIGAYRDNYGKNIILMSQPEEALVLLLLADISGVTAMLLGIRTEPGLIGLTNITTTIQSTPNNYRVEHGGKSTPFINVAVNPSSFGVVLYDGAQYDWGEYYLYKSKRFLIVKLNDPVPAPAGLCWVSKNLSRNLLMEDHLITNDLRVSMAILDSVSRQPIAESNGSRQKVSHFLHPEPFNLGDIDDNQTSVCFVYTKTSTREVGSWVQPLLVPIGPKIIELSSAFRDGEKVFAVEMLSQPGLCGICLWFPAKTVFGSDPVRVTTSAEGGRFFKHKIHINWYDSDVDVCHIHDINPNIFWLTMTQIDTLITTPLRTSLELRMAWSLVKNLDE